MSFAESTMDFKYFCWLYWSIYVITPYLGIYLCLTFILFMHYKPLNADAPRQPRRSKITILQLSKSNLLRLSRLAPFSIFAFLRWMMNKINLSPRNNFLRVAIASMHRWYFPVFERKDIFFSKANSINSTTFFDSVWMCVHIYTVYHSIWTKPVVTIHSD